MRRIMSLWLPDWPTDRLLRAARAPDRPFVTATTTGNRRLVVAASREAVACGITPGLPLADAQAYCPGLAVFPADPAGDAGALRRLAEWCGRWSPWTVPDGGDGILLDIAGCAHLQGGEARLIAEIAGRIFRAGSACRAAIADTAGAAWAVARYGQAAALCIAPGAAREALAELPVAAPRLPSSSVADLQRLPPPPPGAPSSPPRPAPAPRFCAPPAPPPPPPP